MEQYIPKAALVVEIKKRFDEYSNSILRHYDACTEARASELSKILVILNTLEVIDVGVDFGDSEGDKSTFEVKEVDLEEKATQLSQKYFSNEENIWARPNIEAQRCKSACIEMVEWLKVQKGE